MISLSNFDGQKIPAWAMRSYFRELGRCVQFAMCSDINFILCRPARKNRPSSTI